MIKIADKAQCCGCWGCAQRCPEQCISMQEDREGFLYPVVDEALCINCGLCEEVCPVINQNQPVDFEPQSFACVANNENLRAGSSSGGLFTSLATEVIKSGGVVFGARFEPDWSVVHDYTDKIEGLGPFQRSKYVQSVIGNSYNKTESFLKQGKTVMFTGTPCQIAGLNHFLRKPYDNLITIDFACHSVPSPRVWKLYLKEIKNKHNKSLTKTDGQINNNKTITNVTFRDKSQGWKKFGLEIRGNSNSMANNSSVWQSGNHRKNPYMRGFLKDLFVRPSCSSCPAREYKSGSDITIADFWGIEKYHPDIPLFNDNKGVSLALILSRKGKKFFNTTKNKMYVLSVPYNEVEAKQGLHCTLTKSTQPHKSRHKFYTRLDKTKNISKLIEQCLWQAEVKHKIILETKKALHLMFGPRLYQTGKKLIKHQWSTKKK